MSRRRLRAAATPVLTAVAAAAALAGGTAVVAAGPAAAAVNPCVHGAIAARHAALGGDTGVLGRARTCEAATPTKPGRFNHFQNGSIYWSRTTGAWEVRGAILGRWKALGWENSSLGFPTSGETRITGGVLQRFQGASVYWSSATGPKAVKGAILQAYAQSGAEKGRLGFPTTDETATPDGRGRYNHFQRGSVYWSAATGAHVVNGAIRDAWGGQGYEVGRLGYPTSSELPVHGGGRIATFQGGFVEWAPATGAVVTTTPHRLAPVAGCPAPGSTTLPSIAATCVVRGWEQRNVAVLASYGSAGIATQVMDTLGLETLGPWDDYACSAVPVQDWAPAGVECVVRLHDWTPEFVSMGMSRASDGSYHVHDLGFYDASAATAQAGAGLGAVASRSAARVVASATTR